MIEIIVLAGGAFAVASFGLHRLERGPRIACLFYLGIYTLTSGIGAVLWGVSGADPGRILGSTYAEYEAGIGLNMAYGGMHSPFTYWVLVFAPYYVVPVVAGAVPMVRTKLARPERPVSAALLGGLLAGMLGVAFLAIIASGNFGALVQWADPTASYNERIATRRALMAALPGPIFGLIYVSIPVTTVYLLAELKRRYTRPALFWLSVGVIGGLLLTVSVAQKAPLLIFLMGIIIALALLGYLRRSLAPLGLVLALAILNAFQTVTVEGWNFGKTVVHAVFRLSLAIPFYVNVYPHLIPFQGIQLGQDIVGFGPGPRDNLDLSAVMYGQEVGGAVTGAAHIRAYSEAGLIYSLIILVIIGVVLAQFRLRVASPGAFALYMVGIFFTYFVTQTSLREAVISSYGALYGLVPIAFVYMVRRVLPSKDWRSDRLSGRAWIGD